MITLSIEQGIKIQKAHLLKWKEVLKASVYRDLVTYATSSNHEAKDGFGICRGSDLGIYIANYKNYKNKLV